MMPQLSEKNKNTLLRFAWVAMYYFIKNGQRNVFPIEVIELQTKCEVFFKLRKRDRVNLQGCIGLTEKRFFLREAAPIKAISTAVSDSYFPLVTLKAFSQFFWREPDVELSRFESESWFEN